jgi:HPr kinase/phosphorylase
MLNKPFTVLDLLDMEFTGQNALELRCIGGRKGLTRAITVMDTNRPGLALSGFFDAFVFERIQIFGRGECAYLEKLKQENRTDTIERLFAFGIPCCIFSYSQTPNEDFMAIAERVGCPILQTTLETAEFGRRLVRVLSNVFAPKKTMHGVLLEVYGIGILLTGHSGVGKSECALELVERGQRLVADDVVEIRCVNGNTLLGRGSNTLISHHMEIRGLGIINIAQMYGVGSIREQKEIQLVIRLEEWDNSKVYDRVGNNMETIDFLGVKVPTIEIPVKPGRNLPIIIEAAAMNERLKARGYNSARDFNQSILKWIETGEAQTTYYGMDDSY